MICRRKTREISIGNRKIGGNNPIVIQSMCSTKTSDINSTVKQILELEEAGCEIIRIGVPDIESARCISEIKKKIHIPLVADIHYDHNIALEAMREGADKIRINPGNTSVENLRIIVEEAKKRRVAIRIGINHGSLSSRIKQEFGTGPKALVMSALETISLFESWKFHDIAVSLKSSDIIDTIEANREFSEKSDYPLHIGITEAGTLRNSLIKSSVAIGNLLMSGIGDTIRISISADPVEEIIAAQILLRSLGLREGAQLISCPTCARSQIDVIGIAEEIEKKVISIKRNVKIGVMGCFVNSDEARMADIGIAGAVDSAVIFSKGEIIRKVKKEDAIKEILSEIEKL